jgi:hypothetical protein
MLTGRFQLDFYGAGFKFSVNYEEQEEVLVHGVPSCLNDWFIGRDTHLVYRIIKASCFSLFD